MFRALFAVLILSFSPIPLVAADLDYAAGDALRDAAFRGEIDTVETMLREAQARYEAGEIPADQVRILNTPFAYTHPDMVRFIENWRAERPGSPYAKIAEVWFLHRASWNIRGEYPVDGTYPEALQRFSNMQKRAWVLAFEVFKENPRMIHASDALLRLANGTRNHRIAMRAFRQTMADDPNLGTLHRGLDMMSPGWGWKWRHVKKMCNSYAALVENPEPMPELSCMLRKARLFDAKRKTWMYGRLAKGDLRHLDHLRLNSLVIDGHTRADAELIRDLILKGFGTVEDIQTFDQKFMLKFKLEPLTEKITRRRRDAAFEQYAVDPFNLDVLDALLMPVIRTQIDWFGMRKTVVVERPSRAEEIEYRRKKLVAAPFDHRGWENYLQARVRANDLPNLSEFRALHINSIVYSNHDLTAIDIYLVRLIGVYRRMQMVEKGNASEGLKSYYQDVDADTEVICPFIRGYLVYRLRCSPTSGKSCSSNEMIGEAFTEFEADAARRGVCLKERSTHASEMLFTPYSSIDLKTFQSDG